MLTISQLAKRHNLSRSTLLYYDAEGVLHPSGRSAAGYRLYDDRDAARLEKICLYRGAGVALKEIKKILEAPASQMDDILKRRLESVGAEIANLHQQQNMLLVMLNQSLPATGHTMTKESWSALLADMGFSEAAMHDWHRAFEKKSPDKHQAFLEFLDIPAIEITRIRKL